MDPQTRLQQSLLLAMLCLLAVQASSAAHGAHRRLMQNLDDLIPNNNMHVQFTVAIDGRCSALKPAQGISFTEQFRAAFRSDVLTYLTANKQTNAAERLKSAADPACYDGITEGKPYAAIRGHAWFSYVNTTEWRDTLFNATRERMCKGGYSRTIYAQVAKLFADNGLTVIHNNGSRCPRNTATRSCPGAWVAYADPNDPSCSPPVPKPSPSPEESPSPSPSPSPTPSPTLSPSPTPSPSPSNSSSPSPTPSPSPSPSPSPMASPSPSPTISNQTSPSPSPAVSNRTSPSP